MNPLAVTASIETNAKALAFTNFAACLFAAKGDILHASEIFKNRFPRSHYIDTVHKAAVTPGSSSDPIWAGPLAPMSTLGAAFIEYLRPLTVIGRMSGFRRLPFNVKVPRATVATSVGWTGQGAPTAATISGFETITFDISKITGLVVMTSELVKTADPDAQQLIRADLSAATAQFSDAQFLDPSVSEIAGVSPASITYGAPTIAATGTTAAAFAADFAALVALITTSMTAPYLVMRPTTAIALAAMNIQLTRNVGAHGGDIAGIPVITSANVPADGDSPGDNTIILIDAAEVFLNDHGVELDGSGQATIQLSTTPDSPPVATTTLVSLWQQNLAAIKVTRYIRWQRRREGAVAVLTGVGY